MSKIVLALLSTLIFITSMQAQSRGQNVGNGGNIVVCRVSPENVFNGYYSLDYLLTYPGLEPVAAASWQQSLKRISDLILIKVPELHASLESFRKEVYNTSYNQMHVWESASFGLLRIDDQEIAVRLPENCLENDQINVIQAVIRLNPDYSGAETQVFKYMPAAIDQLEAKDPVQTSFLLVHEWLWELSKNVDRNRRIDRYLHSRAFAEHSSAQALATLRSMGLQLTGERYAFDSIQTAIDAAEPGSIVFLLDREYTESQVFIRKPLTIMSKYLNRPAKVKGGSWVIEGSHVTIEGVHFNLNRHQISISGQDVQLVRNRFQPVDPYRASGVHLSSRSEAVFRDNEFFSFQDAVELSPEAKAVFLNNGFSETEWAISMARTAQAKIEKNRFFKSSVKLDLNQDVGVIEIKDNHFEKCLDHACISAEYAAEVSIRNNTFLSSQEGVRFSARSSGSVRNNLFYGNEKGLVIELTVPVISAVQVEENRFERNRKAILNTSGVNIGANVFEGNEQN
jgi:parallel beta-helix repeat protein